MIALSSRGVVRVAGPDAATLLNGLLTNDVAQPSATSLIYAAMLTPQGKYLFDMFIFSPERDIFLLDVTRTGDFVKRLNMYRLRSNVTIEDVSDQMAVYAAISDKDAEVGDYVFADPRLPALGKRIVTAPREAIDDAGYLAHCLEFGVPDPWKDLLVDKDFVLEGLFDELHGIDFHKGCYVGQEMTSRMKRRTSVKNKLCRVRYDGMAPDFETPILADGWEVGRMRSGIDGLGIALIRFDRAAKASNDGHALMAGVQAITLDPPDWLIRPQT